LHCQQDRSRNSKLLCHHSQPRQPRSHQNIPCG
jgi:hypothetical protein